MKFLAKGRTVWAIPNEADGYKAAVKSFPVVVVHRAVVNGDQAALAVAKIMNLHHEEFEK
jgi:hypothetical protein